MFFYFVIEFGIRFLILFFNCLFYFS